MKYKNILPLLALILFSSNGYTNTLPNIDYTAMFFQSISNPQGVRAVSALPATCVAVGAANSTTPVRYQGRVYQCTATNTWAFNTGQSAALTAGRIPIVITGGILSDNSALLSDTNGNLSAASLTITTNTGYTIDASASWFRKTAAHGTTIKGVTGSSNDFLVGTPGGNILIANPTGTNNVSIAPSGNAIIAKLNFANLAFSATAPTVTSAGTSPSITANNGSAAFLVDVGTGGTATTIVLAMPTAATGWICHATNITATAANRSDQSVRQTASTTTSVTLQNQTVSTGAALAFTASDTVRCQCTAY